jgi:hypothetical protein
MTSKQKAVVLLCAAVAGQVYLGRITKQQTVVLGLPVLTPVLLTAAVGAALK